MSRSIRSGLFMVIAAVAVAVIGVTLYIFFTKPTLTSSDFVVQAVIKANETNGAQGKYEFDVQVTKKAVGKSRIYLYTYGYGHTSIYDSHNNISLRPVMTDEVYDQLAADVIGQNLMSYYGEPKVVSLPKGNGNYKFKLFFQEYSGSPPISDIRFVIVHKRQLLWKDLSWAEEAVIIDGLST